MIVVELVSVGGICFALGFICMWFLGLQITKNRLDVENAHAKAAIRVGVGPWSIPAEDIEPPSSKEFPVAGKPRRIPWRERRREIESKHKTKRQRMEEWL